MIWNRQKVDDGDFAEFMGWYLSEGSASGTKGGKIQIPGRGYSIYISQDSQANPENCKKILINQKKKNLNLNLVKVNLVVLVLSL